MKKPTLRLRQVFEGPTHFKVVKPLGNPIKIAKKGLSPNLMGRLRKFAQAGEVTEPIYGTGTTEEQLAQVRRDIENEQLRDDVNPDVLGMLREREQQLVGLRSDEDTPPVTVPKTFLAPQADRLVRDGAGSFEVIKASDVAPVEVVKPPSPRQIAKSAPTEMPAGVPAEIIKSTDIEPAPVGVPAAPPMDVAAIPRVRGLTTAEMPSAPVAPAMQRTTVADEQQIAPSTTAPVFVRRAPGFAPEIAGAPGSAVVEEMPVAIGAEPAPSLPVAVKVEEDLTPVQYARRLIKEELGKKNLNSDVLKQYFETLKDAVEVERAERRRLSQVPASVPAPAAAPAAAVETAPAPAPAPAAAPAAVVTPATPAPTASAVPSAVAPTEKVLTEKAVTASAEKPAPVEASPFEKTLNGLGYTMAQYQAMPAPMKIAAQQAVRATIAAQTAAEEEAKAAEAETAAFAEQQRALKIESDSLQASAKAARETQQKILDEYDYLKNPTSYLGSMSTLGQIGTAISLAAGAFASGMTGMPNFAQKIYDNAIEQDLQAQKRKADSLYQRLVQAGNSVNSAEDLVKAQLKLVGAAELNRRSAQIKLPLVKAQIDAKAASEALKATETLGRVAKDQAAMAREAELRPYQIRKLRAEATIAEGTPARLKKEMDLRIEDAERRREEDKQKRDDRIAAAKTKADEERINRELTIGDVNLELKDDKRAPLIRDGISQRAQALESLLKLEALLSKSKDGYDLWRPGSDTRNEAIAELNFAIENFPKGAGFGRAISVAAKELISKALQEPTSYKSLFKEIFLGKDPAIGIKSLRQEVARNFEEQIVAQSRNTRPQIRVALDSWYKSADEKIKRYKTEMTADEEL